MLSTSLFWVIDSLLPFLVIPCSKQFSLLSFFHQCLSPLKICLSACHCKSSGDLFSSSLNVSFSLSLFVVSVYRLKIWTACLNMCLSLREVASLCLLSVRQHMFAVFPVGSQKSEIAGPLRFGFFSSWGWVIKISEDSLFLQGPTISDFRPLC